MPRGESEATGVREVLLTTQMKSRVQKPKPRTTTPSQTDALLRKLLLAKDVNDVHFHVLSRRSKSRVLDPRVLNANTTLLKSSSKYFADLFSSDTFPSDTAMMNVKATDKILDGVDLSEYGYESDSDLEDDADIPASPARTQVATSSDSGDQDSDTLVLEATPSLEKYYDSPQQNVSDAIGLSSWGPGGVHPTWAVGGGRHIFVKDTAFQTWYCLLHFFYMGTTEFSLLKSSGLRRSGGFFCNASQVSKCSAKSMYRLATKLSIDKLRDRAFASIRSSVDENNLLQELASGFTARHSAVLDMELDLLLEKIACAPIVEGLPKLMARISRNELPHGADIMAGFYSRILQKHYLSQLPTPVSADAVAESAEPVQVDCSGPSEGHLLGQQSPPPSFGIQQPVLVSVAPPTPRPPPFWSSMQR